MSTQVPYLSRLGIYRISIEKQETLIKLMVLSTCAILCKRSYFSGVLGTHSRSTYIETMFVFPGSYSFFHQAVCSSEI